MLSFESLDSLFLCSSEYWEESLRSSNGTVLINTVQGNGFHPEADERGSRRLYREKLPILNHLNIFENIKEHKYF